MNITWLLIVDGVLNSLPLLSLPIIIFWYNTHAPVSAFVFFSCFYSQTSWIVALLWGAESLPITFCLMDWIVVHWIFFVLVGWILVLIILGLDFLPYFVSVLTCWVILLSFGGPVPAGWCFWTHIVGLTCQLCISLVDQQTQWKGVTGGMRRKSRSSPVSMSYMAYYLFSNWSSLNVSINCFGIPRDIYNRTHFPLTTYDPASMHSFSFVWRHFHSPVGFNGGDALAIAVLTVMNYKLAPLGFPPYNGPPLDLSVEAFVSSPNMDYIPDFSINEQYVYVCKNGQFYTHDYTLWP